LLRDPTNGDAGFINPSWLRYGEIMNGRWAMLGAAGCIAPEILGKAGVIPEATGMTWFSSGVFPPAGNYDNYWTDPNSLFFVEVIAIQFAELRRLQDYRNPGSMGKQYFLGIESAFKGSGDPAYPGTCCCWRPQLPSTWRPRACSEAMQGGWARPLWGRRS
jgi:light-harvesting complex I chlorophyll a/b binding protein 3